jgi:cytochrome P450
MTSSSIEHPNLPLPPGRFGFPIIGETLSFLRDPNFTQKRQQQYGSIFKTKILGRPTVVMLGAEANQFILSTHMDYFSWGEGWPPNFKELLGQSLFLQDGEEHQRNRKLLMPAFHGKALASYIATMEAITLRYLQQWQTVETFPWFPELKQMTFEIASCLLMGSEPGNLTNQLSEWFADLTAGLFALPFRFPGTRYYKALKARDRLLEHLEKVIRQRQQNPTQDALGLLVQSQDEEGNGLSLEELKVQALLLLFAGHETTTSMLASFCMSLAQHPHIWEQLRTEQQFICQQTPKLTLETLKKMTYLDQFLQEVERLYPPIGGGFRGVIKPFEFNGYRVPAGWMALYQINATHRDQQVYSNVEQFDPDRFSPQRAEQKNKDFSLVGFGGGPRICLGIAFAKLEMKIVAAHLLRHYQWELLPQQSLELDPIPTLHPRDGLKVKFQIIANNK